MVKTKEASLQSDASHYCEGCLLAFMRSAVGSQTHKRSGQERCGYRMLYKINMITREDGWIAIDTDGWGSEPIRALVASVAGELGGEVVQPYEGDAQFLIKGDPYKLLFQYDDVFGTVVILNDMKDKDEVVALLERHFARLKEA